jgi:hypothetical protein
MDLATTQPTARYARVTCAGITRNCMAFLVMPIAENVDLLDLDPDVPADREARDLLTANDWRLDHGRWVCGLH